MPGKGLRISEKYPTGSFVALAHVARSFPTGFTQHENQC